MTPAGYCLPDSASGRDRDCDCNLSHVVTYRILGTLLPVRNDLTEISPSQRLLICISADLDCRSVAGRRSRTNNRCDDIVIIIGRLSTFEDIRSPEELRVKIAYLRELSGGRPIGGEN